MTNPFALALGLTAALSVLAASAPALASRPVPSVIVGCVVNGAFISSDGFRISPHDANGRAVDLRPLEGHEVRIDGLLLPGDRFILDNAPRDTGRCAAK